MPDDVDQFINYLNNQSIIPTKKRKADYNNIINDLKLIAIQKLEKLDNNVLQFKSRDLTGFLQCLKETFNELIITFKTDSQILNKLAEISRLSFIAELTVCIGMIDEIISYAINNRMKTLSDCLYYYKTYKIKPSKTTISYILNDIKEEPQNKKVKKDISLVDYEDESEYEPSDTEENNNKKYSDNKKTEKYSDDDDTEDESNYRNARSRPKRRIVDNNDFMRQLFKNQETDTETTILKYYNILPKVDRTKAINSIKEINNYHTSEKPMVFRIMELPIGIEQKKSILKIYTNLLVSNFPEKKLRAWFDSLMTIPFNKYSGINLNNIEPNNINEFLNNLQSTMDNAILGHQEAKRQIIQIMGQQIRNPKSKGNVLGIYGPPGNGKCFALNTRILMYDGSYKNVQDVVIGDVIMGDDSTPRNVLSLGSGNDNMYKILSNNGEFYTVNSEHILCLKIYNANKIYRVDKNIFRVQYYDKQINKITTQLFSTFKDSKIFLDELIKTENDIVEITVKDYLKLPNYTKNYLKGYKVGVQFPTTSIDFDPYVLGYWFGCASSGQNSSRFIINHSDILSYLEKAIEKYKLSLMHINGNCYLITDDKQSSDTFTQILNKYNLFNNKHIPNEFKINDLSTRLQILAGIIDSGGIYNETTENFEIIVYTKQLATDIIYLINSLGFGTKQDKIIKNNTYKNINYRITIKANELHNVPLLNSQWKNKIIYKKQNFQMNSLYSNIKVIPKGKGNYYGFTLDGNNRFLLGNFTVTHNTSLIKEGIAKAMNKPFIFISLGGATDGSFLEGHSYTYEGSIYGRIVSGLIDAKCMDPIIYFDELDKIGKCAKGDEIANILVHLTDPVQNTHFRDKYFHGVDIDLSKATLIFSYNDPCNINPILMDRITTIETKFLMLHQKISIAQNYLLPEINKDMGFAKDDITISDHTLQYIIENWTHEGGVRKLKSLLYNIVREINIANLTKQKLNKTNVLFPFYVNLNNIKHILKHKKEITPEKIHDTDLCGVINGLYASGDGSFGGIMPIQILWTPSTKPLKIKATGNLKTVIKESTDVAASLAFNCLDKDLQTKIMDNLKEHPKGLHIHCPEGATPKDGPSAGTAITCAIYSILTDHPIRRDIAITGEINLQGDVMPIGGLENKIEGAKKAGVKTILYPKDNQKDITLIKERNPTLIDNTINIISISTIQEALNHALVSY
jgi:ATP-dependent Lon protease